MQPLTDILNFVQLTPHVGTSGQPLAHQFQEIADAGYKTVINLAMADSDNALADEGALVAGTGMTYIHLPVSAFMYLYLRHVKGLDEEAAKSPMLDKWAPRMDAVWSGFLELSAPEVLPDA